MIDARRIRLFSISSTRRLWMLKLIKGLWLLGVLMLLLLLKLLLMLGHLSVMYATGKSRRIKLIIWIWIRHHWLVRSKRTRNKNLWPCITFYCAGLKFLIYCIFCLYFFLAILCLFNFDFYILAFLLFRSFNLVCSRILTFSLKGKKKLSNELN